MQRPDHAVNIPILHPPSGGDDGDEAQPHDRGTTPPSSGVSFGRVNVHRHRMTLGSAHPFASGIPIELSWDVVSSDEMSMTDYEEEQSSSCTASVTGGDANRDRHGSRSPPRRYTPQDRREIAEEHHTRESIFAILKEASLIRHAIVKSLEEENDFDTLRYVNDASEEEPNKTSPSSPPPPPSHSNEPAVRPAPLVLPSQHPADETTKMPAAKIPWSKHLCERMQKECPIETSRTSTKTTTSTTDPLLKSLSYKTSTSSNTKNLKWSKRVCHRLQDWEKA